MNLAIAYLVHRRLHTAWTYSASNQGTGQFGVANGETDDG